MPEKPSVAQHIAAAITAAIAVKQAMLDDPALCGEIQRACDLLIETYAAGHKVLLAGNGGSAADAQHIAAELVVRLQAHRRALPAIALTTDSSILTAASNDYGYAQVFRRQIEALAQPGDVFIAISTSGHSPNILAALAACPGLGVTRLGLTGGAGGAMPECCECCLKVPSLITARIQEAHILLGHIFCQAVEDYAMGLMVPPASPTKATEDRL